MLVSKAEARPVEGTSMALRVALALQVVLGLLWGVSMLFFAPKIVLTDPTGPHIEKIALEGGAHFMLVFGAILVWRAPREAASALWMMIFLNAIWTLTDLVYIPLFQLTALDFPAKLAVNALLTVALAWSGWRAGLLSR
jgi:hypothetical protein